MSKNRNKPKNLIDELKNSMLKIQFLIKRKKEGIKNFIDSKIPYKTRRKIKAIIMNKKDMITDLKFYFFLIVVLFVFFVVFSYYADRDLRSNITAEIIGIFITVVVIDRFLIKWSVHSEWKKMKNRVMNVLTKETSGLFTDVSNFCHFDKVIAGDFSDEELRDKFAEKLGKQLEESAKTGVVISKTYVNSLLEGQWTELLQRRKDFLDNFERKYSKHLKTEVVIALINIQEALDRINLTIAVYNKLQGTMLQNSEKQTVTKLNTLFHDIVKSLNTLYDYGYLETW